MMDNPYNHPRLRRLKRSSKSRYRWALVGQFPKYIGWRLSKLVPDELGLRFRRHFGFLVVPFKQVADFVRLWIHTRPWKKLLFALPLLMVLVWIFSTIFLANNLSDEELYGEYRSSMLNAVSQGNYELADFLSGKLLLNPAYARDEQMLFAAMIAANENGNIPRRDLLLKRLTEELEYAPAHMWFAQRLLSSQGGGAGNLQKAIQHVQSALEVSDNPEPIRIQLARMYFQSRRSEQAIRILEGVSDPEPSTSILLAKLYLSVDSKEKANDVVTRLIEQLDIEDPKHSRYMMERIEAFTILTEARGNKEYVMSSMLDMARLLENKVVLSPDDMAIQFQLVKSYMVTARLLLEQKDDVSRRKALVYFEKAIAAGEVPYMMGSVIFSASNLDSSGGLTEAQMRDALVHGKGVAVAHVFLGLDAWKKDLMDDATFHFSLAHALQPNTLTVVEHVAVHIAQASKEGTLNPFRLSLESEPLWRRSLRLLDIASKIDAAGFEQNLYTQCMILSNRQRWAEIPILAEPHLDKISEKYRVNFIRLLIRAYGESRDLEKVKEYTEMLKAELPTNVR